MNGTYDRTRASYRGQDLVEEARRMPQLADLYAQWYEMEVGEPMPKGSDLYKS